MRIWKKSKCIVLAGILIFLVLPVVCRGQDHQQAVKLEDLVAELVRSNPEIQAAAARYQAALTRPAVEGALPDPKISLGWMSPGSILPGRQLGQDPNANIGLQIGQEFPYPGKLSLRSDVARKEADNVKYMYSAAVREKVAELKRACYELALVDQTMDLLRENQDVLRQLSKVAEVRYTVGKAMQQDLIKAGTEVSILENRLIALTQQKQSISAEINAMLNRPVSTSPVQVQLISDPPPLEPLETLQSRLKQNAPMLLAQQAMINGRQLGVKLARKEYYPDFDLMSGYYNQGKMPDMWEVRFGVSIPVFYKRKQQKEAEQAAQQLIEAQQNYRAAEQMLNYRLQDAYVKAQTARNLADLYDRQIVPQSRLALESSLASYQTGGVDFLTVFSNFNMILEYRMNLYEQQAEYLKALAILEELTAWPGNEVQS